MIKRKKKSRIQCKILLRFFLLGIVGIYLSLYARIQQAPSFEQKTLELNKVPQSSIHAQQKDPSTSKPPQAIPLFATNSTFVKKRHECIARIRERQHEILGPLLGNDLLLVDPAYHRNVGDHMLTLGELEFLNQHGHEQVSQCNYLQAGPLFPSCESAIYPQNGDTVAIWHAGGNWGDLWPSVQDARTQSFTALLKAGYRILGMPQSLFFKNTETEKRNAQVINESVLKVQGGKYDRDRLRLAWREHESFEKASDLYPCATHYLVPDIAFQLGPYSAAPPPSVRQVDLVLFLRDDHESKFKTFRDRSVVRDLLVSNNIELTFTVVDWEDRLYLFDSDDYYFTETAIQLMTQGRIVICDRLHAAILAYLVGIPFIYLDQISGKISKTLRVAFEGSSVCQDGKQLLWEQASNISDALLKAQTLLEVHNLRISSSRTRRKRGPN